MKSKSLLFLFCFSVIAIFIIGFYSCRKMATDVLLPESNNKFDAAAAKEWYYGVFKKSAEWKSYYSKSNNRTSQANGKKLPNWKHGVYRKVGNMEIVEFPLDQSRTSIPIEKNTLSTADIKKIAAASLTRIAFIKRGNEISVREIDYIPEWTYLQKKKFDISDVMFGRTSGDFSGRVLIKKWNGDVLSRRVLENGRTVKKGRVVNSTGVTTGRSTEPCPTVEVCLWQQDCNEVWAGDQYLFTTCGDWYVLYCWNEEICEEEEDECAGMSEEECVCYMFGICNEGDPECRGCTPPECSMSESDAQQALDAVTGTTEGIVSYAYGIPLLDSYGVIREPVTASFPIYSLQFTTGYWIRYSGHGSGIRYKNSIAGRWKWESFQKSTQITKDNIYPACWSDEMTATISEPVFSADRETATLAVSYNLTLSLFCLGGQKVANRSGSHPVNVYADE